MGLLVVQRSVHRAQSPPPAGSVNGNICFDSQTNPVSVNIAFFEVCAGCSLGTTDLIGSGFDNGFGSGGDAGGTSWLQTQAPVTGGETFSIRFAIWDTGDTALDSTAGIDAFDWIANGGTVVVETTSAQYEADLTGRPTRRARRSTTKAPVASVRDRDAVLLERRGDLSVRVTEGVAHPTRDHGVGRVHGPQQLGGGRGPAAVVAHLQEICREIRRRLEQPELRLLFGVPTPAARCAPW
ncbi:MAG: hypothetical protein IPM79_37200 [Polyangiaceae bacterium]|nr:hypothetical protein [Polyangiaceae bacterium]